LVLLATLVLSACRAATADSTINATNRYAYGANVGWLDWRADGTNGAAIGEYVCSGCLYGPNVGWVWLGGGAPTSGIRYANRSANDCGVNVLSNGLLRGFAWSPAVGWLAFEPQGDPRVNLLSGALSGHVWGANVGWIGLSNVVAHAATDRLAAGADTNHNGIPDAWELEKVGSLDKLTATGDWDGDGVPGMEEYVAGTAPDNAGDNLRIVAAQVDRVALRLAWNPRSDRIYRIETRSALTGSVTWVDCGLGLLASDPGSPATQTFSMASRTSCFFRVRACLPLGR